MQHLPQQFQQLTKQPQELTRQSARQMSEQLDKQLLRQASKQLSQQLLHNHKQQQQSQQYSQFADALQTVIDQQPVSWVLTEGDLRASLAQSSTQQVLHILDMGQVVLISQRLWDRRRSHASFDQWRWTLYGVV